MLLKYSKQVRATTAYLHSEAREYHGWADDGVTKRTVLVAHQRMSAIHPRCYRPSIEPFISVVKLEE